MKHNRRQFIRQVSLATGGLALASVLPSFTFLSEDTKKFDFKISLAQWSLNKSLFSKKISTLDFPEVAKTKFGIEAVEYVNQFFSDKAEDIDFLKQLKQRCDNNGVRSLLIMIDGEGSLAESDVTLRTKAIENHYKWVTAAKLLGCHSIRVNLHGAGTAGEWQKSSVDALSKLSNFSADYKINILVENHGGFSSNGSMLAEVIKQVNSPFCGTLPDFGNFCFRREKGDLWESPCIEWYDRYKGVEEMLPYAKGVSAKSFDFDKKGNETSTDFLKMMKIVKASGYKGYLGIEYEGNRLSEEEGIRLTKNLLEKIRKEIA
jgi:sugar phosphate isomerase/epimerase